MPTRSSLIESLAPYARRIAGLDLTQPESATRALNEALSPGDRASLEKLLLECHAEGWLTPKEAAPNGVWFGRVAKPSELTAGFSIDAVDMEGEAAEHTHPLGEVSFCVAREGEPRFDGHPPGWVVLPPGSHHTPTVRGGRMLIVYFLPEGAVEWGPKASDSAERP